MEYPIDLQKALSDNKVTFVTGAGFSAMTSPTMKSSSWINLIREGTDFALTAFPDDNLLAGLKETLDRDTANYTEDDLTQYAGIIKSALLKKSDQLYADFFINQFQNATVENDELGRLLASFNCCLATTNYDDLLEKSIGLAPGPTLLQDEVDTALSILRNEKQGVVHLHGRWDKPNSVLFDKDDYTRHLGNVGATATQLSLFSLTKFVFVGQGSGVLDPNFTALKNAWAKVSPVSIHRHYLLCLERDRDYYTEALAGCTIQPLVYGSHYDDLPKFLQGLLESISKPSKEIELFRTVNTMAEELQDDLREASLADQKLLATAPLLDLIVVPTFIPQPHEQFSHEQLHQEREGIPPEERTPPISVDEILKGENSWLIVGEEQSGLTTALKWILLNRQTHGLGEAPVYVDHLNYSNSNRLNKLIRKQFMSGGMRLQPKDSFPPFDLAVDSFTEGSSKSFHNFISDLIDSGASRIFVGCRLGSEHELAAQLLRKGINLRIAYLGKPSLDDIKKYAEIVAPENIVDAPDHTREIIRKEHLPRNPFTISLVLRLISNNSTQAEKLQSQADLISGFLDLMLSRNSIQVDARETLDYSNIEVILMELAETLVRVRSASISADRIVELFRDVITRKEWDENAVEWVGRLVNLRLLHVSGNEYSFRQSSYLFYYAARAAIKRKAFLRYLLEEPLMHAPIIKMVASIAHDDDDLVAGTANLLTEWGDYVVDSAVFAAVTKQDSSEFPEIDSDSTDEEIEESPEEDAASAHGKYDYSLDKDVLPFPLQAFTDVPETIKLRIAVDLASVVLRESNEIDDRELKDASLEKILNAWGVYLDLLEKDEDVRGRNRQAIIDGARRHGLDDVDIDEVLNGFNPMYCAFVVWGSMWESLRSKKLRSSLDRVRAAAIGGQRLALISGVAFMELTDTSRGWATRVSKCTDQLNERWIFSYFISDVVIGHYVHSELAPDDAKVATELIKKKIRSLVTFKNAQDEKARLGMAISNLDKYRLNRRSAMRQIAAAFDAN